MGDLFADPGSSAGLAEALEAAAAWPEIAGANHRHASVQNSNFALLLARITAEDPNEITAAMRDDTNVAGRVLRSIEMRLLAHKQTRRDRAGRPPSPNKLLALILKVVLRRDAPEDQGERAAVARGKLGGSRQSSQMTEDARKFSRQFRPS